MKAKDIIKIIKETKEWHYKAYNGTLNDGYKHGNKNEHLLVVQVLDRILEDINK